MNCSGAKYLLPLYASGELDAKAMAELELHLEQCAACGREAEESRGAELTALRAEVSELALLRHEVARVARLGTDLLALSGLRDAAWSTGHRGSAWEEVTNRTCRELGCFDPDIRHRTNDGVVSLALRVPVAGLSWSAFTTLLNAVDRVAGPLADSDLWERLLTGIRAVLDPALIRPNLELATDDLVRLEADWRAFQGEFGSSRPLGAMAGAGSLPEPRFGEGASHKRSAEARSRRFRRLPAGGAEFPTEGARRGTGRDATPDRCREGCSTDCRRKR